MKNLYNTGYYVCLLFALSIFLSVKAQNILGILLLLLFIISMFSKENREKLKLLTDKQIILGLAVFIVTPYIIALIDGGLKARIDMDDYIKFILFLPLVFFLDTEKKFWNFFKSILTGGTVSLIITLFIFIKNYDEWAHPKGFVYPRVFFELDPQDFANIMCLLLLFLISFFLFYKFEKKEDNFKFKLLYFFIIVLNVFILLVNRSKMVYICLIPTVIYILYKKNKKYIAVFFIFCIGGFFLLPHTISDRLQYIVKVQKDPSSNLRLIFWDGAIASIKQSPLIGMKSEQRRDFVENYYKQKGVYDYVVANYEFVKTRNVLDTHNMYLQFLTYFGIIGFISLIFFFFFVIPKKLLSISFYKNREKNEEKSEYSKFIALEIALKASYACYLIQGLTEINLNNKSIILAFSVLIYILNFVIHKNFKMKLN